MIAPVRASRGEGEWGLDKIACIQDRMTAFATAVLQQRPVEGHVEPETLRDLVAFAPPRWPGPWAEISPSRDPFQRNFGRAAAIV